MAFLKTSWANVNKKQLFEAMWIPIAKRLPPDNDKRILCWNNDVCVPVISTGKIVRIGIKGGWSNITEWMQVYGGRNGDGGSQLSTRGMVD